MHAQASENLFGVQTHYGTHPKQPHPRRTRLTAVVTGAGAAVMVAAAAAATFLRR